MPWHYVPEVDAFTIYHKTQEEHAPDQDFSFSNSFGHAIAGAAGTAVSNVVVYPLDLVVTRLQVQSKEPKDPRAAFAFLDDSRRYKGLADAFHKIYHTEGGAAAFYGGVTQDTLKSMADSFLFFLAYNALYNARQRSTAADRGLLARLLDEVGIGMLAGAFTKGVTFPLQQVVTRKQSGDRAAAKASVRDILADVYRRHGLAGFWSGYSATLILTLNPSLAMSVHSFLERALVGDAAGGPGALLTFLFAATSKAVASCAMYPVSLAKTRAQAGSSDDDDDDKGGKKNSGPLSVLRAIHRVASTDGVGALYAGVTGEVLKGFFSHGLTMLVKQRIQSVVIALYFWLLGRLRALRKG